MDTNKARKHDVIVIGSGAAGLSAALVLARARVNVLVIDSGEPRNSPAAHMHGFVSRDGMPPQEFLESGRREVRSYGANFESSTVTAIDRRYEGGFDVTLADATVHTARALLIATGLKDQLPETPGLRPLWGSLVNHCPYCHGHEVCDQAIAVIGGLAREMSLKQAALLRRYSDRVDFISNGIQLTSIERHRLEAFGVRIIDGAVSRISAEAEVSIQIELTDQRTLSYDAGFIAPVTQPSDQLLRSLGCEVDSATGLIAADPAGQTSQPGVWAAGNVVTPSAQVITAAGAGSVSAIAINGWLLQKDLDVAAAKTRTNTNLRDGARTKPKNKPAGPPSVHVRAVITWIAIFPLVTLGFFAIAPFAAEWPPVLRAFVLSIVVVPVAVYLVVPQLMKIHKALTSKRNQLLGKV